MPHIPMEYTVDLGNTINVTPLHTLFAMGDDNAHRFAFSIVQYGKPVDLSGCTVLATYTNFTPNGVTVNLEGKIEDGKAVALLSKACYTMEGRFALVVRIKNSVGTSAIFYGDGYMSQTTADTVIDGDYIIYDVNTILEKIAEINASTEAANKATANANTSAQNANASADTANTAAGNANKAAEAANTAAENWDSSYAADSAKLGGKSPTEYASAAEVSHLKDEKANKSDVLTLEEIEASTDLSGKIASASALKQTYQKTVYKNTVYGTFDDASKTITYDFSSLINLHGMFVFSFRHSNNGRFVISVLSSWQTVELGRIEQNDPGTVNINGHIETGDFTIAFTNSTFSSTLSGSCSVTGISII